MKTKRKYCEIPLEYQELMLIRQAQAGNRINPNVFWLKIDASKAEGGFNFLEDKEVNWNEIFYWDGKSPLPECPLPKPKYPKQETLVPSTDDKLPTEPIVVGGIKHYAIASNENFYFYASEDTIKGMKHDKKSKVYLQKKTQ